MRLVDTSAWIEWLLGSPIGLQVHDQFPAREDQLVPTIVQMELAVWAKRELSTADARRVLADSTKCIVVALDTAIALRAADLRHHTKLATADAIIYATALSHGADILTCDAHFEGLPHVLYVPKAPHP